MLESFCQFYTTNSFHQVFALLMAEMVVFMTLIVPMPFSLRRRLFVFLSENPVVAKLQYGLKVWSHEH